MGRIGVFLRCTGIDDIPAALSAVRERIGVDVIHLSKLPDRYYSPRGIEEVKRMIGESGVHVDAVTIVHDGESYADIETIRKTVGYLPPETLQQRIEFSCRCADLASAIECPLVTTHMGMLPENVDDPGYRRLLRAVGQVASYCDSRRVRLALETGQETADEMRHFLERLEATDVAINMDPGNLVLYDKGDPLVFLREFLGRIASFHVKDGVPPTRPELLGREVSPGQGAARVTDCVRLLLQHGYAGSFVIENYVKRDGSIDDKLEELRKVKQRLEPLLDERAAQ